MPTTTGSSNLYSKGLGALVAGTANLTDVRVLLTTSSYTPSTAHDFVNDITNEVTGSGYARVSLTGEAKTEVSTGLWMFDSDNPTWTASGGSIVARYWVLFSFVTNDADSPLLAYGLLDSTPADVTTPSGSPLTINVPATGWFRWTG
jgi:hypothetical protein